MRREDFDVVEIKEGEWSVWDSKNQRPYVVIELGDTEVGDSSVEIYDAHNDKFLTKRSELYKDILDAIVDFESGE